MPNKAKHQIEEIRNKITDKTMAWDVILTTISDATYNAFQRYTGHLPRRAESLELEFLLTVVFAAAAPALGEYVSICLLAGTEKRGGEVAKELVKGPIEEGVRYLGELASQRVEAPSLRFSTASGPAGRVKDIAKAYKIYFHDLWHTLNSIQYNRGWIDEDDVNKVWAMLEILAILVAIRGVGAHGLGSDCTRIREGPVG
jgi:hypothetical protein